MIRDKIRRFAAPVIRARWATPDTAFTPPIPDVSMDGMRESAIEKRMLPTVSSYPTKKSDPLAYSGAVPLPGAAAPAASKVDKSKWTGLTSSGIPYDESLYGPWHHYATPAGKEELKKSFRLPKAEGIHRRDVMGRSRVLPTGYYGSPDFYERTARAERKFTDKVDALVAGGMRSADAEVIADADPSIWKGYAHMDPGEGPDGSPSVGYWGEDPTSTPLWTYDPDGDGSTWLSGGW